MKLAQLFNRVVRDVPTPWAKQLPITAFFLLALVFILVRPEVFVTTPGAVVVGMGLAFFASLLAPYFTHPGAMSQWSLVVPALDLIAIGFLRAGTGSNSSAFGALVILPVVWLAMEHGRRFVLYAVVGGGFAFLIPVALNTSLFADLPYIVRSFVTLVIYAMVAVVVNEFSRQSRLRIDTAHRQTAQRAEMLKATVAHVEQLAESEARLSALERMFRGLWEAVTEQSVIGTDRSGLIDAWNPGAAKMLGLLDAETEGIRRIEEFHLAEELEARSRELDLTPETSMSNLGFSALIEPARQGRADVREWTYVTADDRNLPVELAVTARVNEEGEIVGYLFVASDMTKAKELARLKDEFVGLISHELRTPLSSIIGYLELLRDEEGVELSANQLRYLAVAERNAQRLLGLVGDLLFTAQVDSGMFRITLSEQRLDEIVSAAVESARPAAASAGVTLTAQIAADTVIPGDAVRLGQACDNLLSNALKFTPGGGEVTVTLTADGANAVVAVSDTGMGIASAELNRLFSRFFRASTATRNAVPGVGLGLVITKAIVTAHGGELGVTSEEGKGTCFTMTLPRGGSSV